MIDGDHRRNAELAHVLDVALQMAQTAKSRLPNRHEIDDTLGWIYIKKNLSDSAISIFRDLVAREPQRAIRTRPAACATSIHATGSVNEVAPPSGRAGDHITAPFTHI